MDNELQFHIERYTEDLVREGVSLEEDQCTHSILVCLPVAGRCACERVVTERRTASIKVGGWPLAAGRREGTRMIKGLEGSDLHNPCSEQQLQRHLPDSGGPGIRHESETSVVDVSRRGHELRVVEGVKEFEPELEQLRLGESGLPFRGSRQLYTYWCL